MNRRAADGGLAEQLALPLDELAAGPVPAGPREFRAGGRTFGVSECFDTFWLFAAERQRIFHAPRCGRAAAVDDRPGA